MNDHDDTLTIDFLFENGGYVAIKKMVGFKKCFNREELKAALTFKLTPRSIRRATPSLAPLREGQK